MPENRRKKHTHTASWGKSSWPWLLCFALLQNRENQLKNLQHQKEQKAPKGRGEDGKGQGGLQLFDLSAASKSAKRRKMKTVCRLATWHAAGEAGGGNENAKNGKNFALAVDLCHIPPSHHPPCDHKVNADKFHDLTNAAEINTATCNVQQPQRVLWGFCHDCDSDYTCTVPSFLSPLHPFRPLTTSTST